MQLLERIARTILWLIAITMTGLSIYMILAPQSFQDMVQFAPYNRHYIGDAAIFQLLSGLVLGWVALAPARRSVAIWLVLLVSALHTLNHLYDLLFVSTPPVQSLWTNQAIGLGVASLLLILPGWFYAARAKAR